MLDQDPVRLLGIKIPDYWKDKDEIIEHKLPQPDFDDTGFVGRQQDRKSLLNLLLGSHPVFTVTGEGGVGKSALAVQCLYDLLPHRDRFDAIVWTSLKSAQLTAGGVRQVLDSWRDEFDVLRSIAKRFGTDTTELDNDDLFESVLEIMGPPELF